MTSSVVWDFSWFYAPFEPLAPTWQNASNKMLKSAPTISLNVVNSRGIP